MVLPALHPVATLDLALHRLDGQTGVNLCGLERHESKKVGHDQPLQFTDSTTPPV